MMEPKQSGRNSEVVPSNFFWSLNLPKSLSIMTTRVKHAQRSWSPTLHQRESKKAGVRTYPIYYWMKWDLLFSGVIAQATTQLQHWHSKIISRQEWKWKWMIVSGMVGRNTHQILLVRRICHWSFTSREELVMLPNTNITLNLPIHLQTKGVD